MSRQAASAVGVTVCIERIRETRRADEAVVVVMVHDVYGLVGIRRTGTLSLLRHATVLIIQVVGIPPMTALVTVLRERQTVGIVIFIRDGLRSRQGLTAAQALFVILILEGMHTQVGSGLEFRLEHQYKVAVTVVHVVRIQILRTVHTAFQHRAPLPVREGIGHVVVLVRSLQHMERTRRICGTSSVFAFAL